MEINGIINDVLRGRKEDLEQAGINTNHHSTLYQFSLVDLDYVIDMWLRLGFYLRGVSPVYIYIYIYIFK